MQTRTTRRRTVMPMDATDAPMVRRTEALPAVRERDDIPASAAPDFDAQDMIWAFFFAASVGSGNLTGAVAVAAGFVVQKQIRRDPETLQRAGDFLLAAVPGLDVANRRLPALPSWSKRRHEESIDAEIVDEPTPRPAPPAPQPRGEARQATTATRPRWLEVVNDQPDLTPHALILGGSGVGKTTMATAIMGDRGGRTVVISPKVSAGGWAGAEVVSLDDDGSYAPITAALTDLEDEKRRRVVALRRDGRDGLEPLTIVLDELVDLTAREPKAGELMVNLSSIGREINMRLIGVGTTDDALGVKGWKASRNNYVRIEMDEQRRAQITQGKRSLSVPAQDTLSRARGVQLRPWRGEPEPAPAVTGTTQNLVRYSAPPAQAARPADLLGALMAELPADVAAAVPDISPERAARLAAIVAGQSVTVERPAGGDVHVHVQQATVSAPGRARATRPGGVNTRRMKSRADEYRTVKAVIARGGSANDAQREAQIGRGKALAYARKARAEIGGSE